MMCGEVGNCEKIKSSIKYFKLVPSVKFGTSLQSVSRTGAVFTKILKPILCFQNEELFLVVKAILSFDKEKLLYLMI